MKIFDFDTIDLKSQSRSNSGLLVDLRLPNSKLNQIIETINKISLIFNVKYFKCIPHIQERSISDFTSSIIKKSLNPFKAHLWKEKSKKWNRAKYFDRDGIPFGYKELKKRK